MPPGFRFSLDAVYHEPHTVDDETQVPLPNLLEDFAVAQIEKIKGNEDKAKVYEDLKDYSKAATFHQKAVEAMRSHPPKEHARPAVLADMEAHLAYAQYKAGDKNAYIRLKSAIADLEKAGETPYNKDVWLSGAHMRAAQMLREDSPDDAKIHLQRAKEIIDNNKELTLRAEQWEKLAALFTDRVS